jgi:hypothetical protein
MDWDASPDALAVHSVTGGEDKPSRETKVLYWNAAQLYFDLWRKRVRILRMTRTTALVLKISCDILTVSVLQGLQVALSCQCPGYGRDLNVYIHNTTGRRENGSKAA